MCCFTSVPLPLLVQCCRWLCFEVPMESSINRLWSACQQTPPGKSLLSVLFSRPDIRRCELCEICVSYKSSERVRNEGDSFLRDCVGANKSPFPISCIIHHTLTQGKKHLLGGTFGIHEHVNTCEAREGHVLWILIQYCRGASCVSTVVVSTSEVAAAGGKLYGCLVLKRGHQDQTHLCRCWGQEINDSMMVF